MDEIDVFAVDLWVGVQWKNGGMSRKVFSNIYEATQWTSEPQHDGECRREIRKTNLGDLLEHLLNRETV